MRRCRLGAFGLAVALSILFSSALVYGRALAARHLEGGGPVNVELFAKASNGYEAELDSEGDKLRLSFSHGLLPALTYTFRGKVTTEGVKARIVGLGSIDLRFVPAPGNATKVPQARRCGDEAARATRGHFVGSLDFRAELGAVKLNLSRARGWVIVPGWRCPAASFKDFAESQPRGKKYTLLQAEERKRHLRFSTFTATDSKHPVPEGVEVSAEMITRRGPVIVDHLAVLLGQGIFSFGDTLSNAAVDPGGAFHGNATFCASCAPGARWTGDLSVSLPGIPGDVALAGPAFDATLKRVASGAGDTEKTQDRNP
jgi:hypothetical protein